MKPRFSFSSRHTKRRENISKQKKKYPSIVQKIIENSDIILEVLDSRFPNETRNEDFEKEVFSKGKKLIFVLNKSDLVRTETLRKIKLSPRVFVSCTKRDGTGNLRNRIKKEAKKIENPLDKDKSGKVTVGVIGYPNTGKSSLINLLVGKSSAGTSSQSGFTKSLQKLRLTEGIQLLDSPGVIPDNEYSSEDKKKIAHHAKLGARDFSKVKDPELAVVELINEFSKFLEKHYKIKFDGDSEILIEELGKKKGFFKKGGEIDEDKTARFILKDWQTGNIKI